MRRGTERPDPTRTYVSWQSVAVAEVPFGVLQRGTRLLGSDPLVRARPEFFVPDGEDLEARMKQKLVESIGAARGEAA